MHKAPKTPPLSPAQGQDSSQPEAKNSHFPMQGLSQQPHQMLQTQGLSRAQTSQAQEAPPSTFKALTHEGSQINKIVKASWDKRETIKILPDQHIVDSMNKKDLDNLTPPHFSPGPNFSQFTEKRIFTDLKNSTLERSLNFLSYMYSLPRHDEKQSKDIDYQKFNINAELKKAQKDNKITAFINQDKIQNQYQQGSEQDCIAFFQTLDPCLPYLLTNQSVATSPHHSILFYQKGDWFIYDGQYIDPKDKNARAKAALLPISKYSNFMYLLPEGKEYLCHQGASANPAQDFLIEPLDKSRVALLNDLVFTQRETHIKQASIEKPKINPYPDHPDASKIALLPFNQSIDRVISKIDPTFNIDENLVLNIEAIDIFKIIRNTNNYAREIMTNGFSYETARNKEVGIEKKLIKEKQYILRNGSNDEDKKKGCYYLAEYDIENGWTISNDERKITLINNKNEFTEEAMKELFYSDIKNASVKLYHSLNFFEVTDERKKLLADIVKFVRYSPKSNLDKIFTSSKKPISINRPSNLQIDINQRKAFLQKEKQWLSQASDLEKCLFTLAPSKLQQSIEENKQQIFSIKEILTKANALKSHNESTYNLYHKFLDSADKFKSNLGLSRDKKYIIRTGKNNQVGDFGVLWVENDRWMYQNGTQVFEFMDHLFKLSDKANALCHLDKWGKDQENYSMEIFSITDEKIDILSQYQHIFATQGSIKAEEYLIETAQNN